MTATRSRIVDVEPGSPDYVVPLPVRSAAAQPVPLRSAERERDRGADAHQACSLSERRCARGPPSCAKAKTAPSDAGRSSPAVGPLASGPLSAAFLPARHSSPRHQARPHRQAHAFPSARQPGAQASRPLPSLRVYTRDPLPRGVARFSRRTGPNFALPLVFPVELGYSLAWGWDVPCAWWAPSWRRLRYSLLKPGLPSSFPRCPLSPPRRPAAGTEPAGTSRPGPQHAVSPGARRAGTRRPGPPTSGLPAFDT